VTCDPFEFLTMGECVVYFAICYNNAKIQQGFYGDGKSLFSLKISMDIYDQICN
jgi:hypothetical protein